MSASTKTIAIVGITGNQGAATATTFLADPRYKVRGISRNPSSPKSQEWISQGASVVAGNLNDPESLKSAFKDASVVFAVTDFWAHFVDPEVHALSAKQGVTPNEIAYEREIQQGRNIVDAVAANVETLDRFVFSSLIGTKEITKGKIGFNLHFDSKAEIVKYLKETYPELDKKTSYVLLGSYATNWKLKMGIPEIQEDGSYVLKLGAGGKSKVPFVDPKDTGKVVKRLVELPAGKIIVAAGSLMGFEDFWCDLWAEHVGVKCTYERLDRKVLEDSMGAWGREIADMFQFMDEYGYDGGDPNVLYPWDAGVEGMTTMEEYVKMEDWSALLKPKET